MATEVSSSTGGLDVGLSASPDDLGSSDMESTNRLENEELQNRTPTHLAQTETKTVGWLRLMLVTLLGLVAVSISLAAYRTTKSSERRVFENDTNNIVEKFIATFESTVRQRIAIIDNFSVDITSFVKDNTNVEWPFVSLPNFEIRAGQTAELAGLMSLGLLVSVETEAEKLAFLSFAANDSTQEEGIALQLGIPVENVTQVPRFSTLMARTPAGYEVDTSSGPYLISNQVYPARTSVWRGQNYLAVPELGELLWTVLVNGTMGVGASFDFIDPETRNEPRYDIIQQNLKASGFGRVDGLGYENDTAAALFYPGKISSSI